MYNEYKGLIFMKNDEVIERLQELQDILAEKYDLEAKVNELPKTLDSGNESLDRFKKEYIDINSNYEEEKSKIATLRNDLQDAITKLSNAEKGMESDGLSNHEIDNLKRQITEAKDRENSIRQDVLREEKKLAELDEKLKTYEALISSTESDVNSSRENLSKDIEKNKKQIAELAAKEASLSEGIDPEIVFKFQRIIQRNRKGIVAVRGNVCDGCHMILPAQFANEVHDGNEILFCPYCSRILFYEESDTNVNTFYSTEEGDLSDLDNGELDDIFGLSDEDSEDQDSEA